MSRHNAWKGADGFTLLELLITVSVLGILVGISFLFSGIDLLVFSAAFHGPDDRGGPAQPA